MKAKRARDDSTSLSQRLRAHERRMSEAHRIASAAAHFDKTDPFTYQRIFSRVLNGIGEEFRFGDGK